MEIKKSNMGTGIKMIFIKQLISIQDFIKKHIFLYKCFLKLYLTCIDCILILKKGLFKLMERKDDCLNINIGGGRFLRKHWKVLDFPSEHYNYPRNIIDYEFDLTSSNPFPFFDNTVSLFYLSHVLEHIPQEFCQHILNEIYRCLGRGGGTYYWTRF